MEFIKRLLVSFFCCLLASAYPYGDPMTRMMCGNYVFSVVEPLYLTSASQHYSVNYLVTKGSSHAFEVNLKSSVTESLYHANILAKNNVELVGLSKYRRYYYANYHLSIEFDVPTRYVNKSSANQIFLTDHLYDDDGSIEIRHRSSFMYIYPFRPRTWGNELYKTGPLSRGFPTYIRIEDGFSLRNNPFEIEHTGFASAFLNPENNRLPLGDMKLRFRNCEKRYVAPSFSKATLAIRGDISLFAIGKRVTARGGDYLAFPLQMMRGSSSFYHLALRDLYYVSSDLRYLRTKENHLEGDVPTNDLYLPPYEAGKSQSYQMSIIIEQVGDMGKDTIKADFSCMKDRNFIGSCLTSSWCVVEGR